ncbi:hypothetical protein F4779DRAFT_559827 [Xylariaceae sp. FL0662B]|nr:hypothetical protein F4779DRAFT_559827 [Xylariaceae sp. FL0662B]
MALRHSSSQVFGTKHPALSPREDDDRADSYRYPWMWRGRTAAHAPVEQPRIYNTTTITTKQASSSHIHHAQHHIFNSNTPPPLPSPSHAPNSQIPNVAALYEAAPASSSSSPLYFQEQQQPLAPMATAAQMRMPIPTRVSPYSSVTAPHIRDASTLHPVFFTPRLRKSAFGADAAAAAAASPVAHGYVYHLTQGRGAEGAVPAML